MWLAGSTGSASLRGWRYIPVLQVADQAQVAVAGPAGLDPDGRDRMRSHGTIASRLRDADRRTAPRHAPAPATWDRRWHGTEVSCGRSRSVGVPAGPDM